MFERILVPLDGSTLAEQALTPALKIAAHTGAEVLLLRSVRKEQLHILGAADYTPLRPSKTYAQLRDDAQTYLYGLVKAHIKPEFTMDVIIETGDAATAIVDSAVHEPADLIVMTTHGASGLDRWMFGSVTEKVLRHAPCPVLALRSAELPKNFLVTLDGSELSEKVIDPAVIIAQAFGAMITLLRIERASDEPDWGELKALETMDRELAQHVSVQYEKTVGDYLEKLRVGRLADMGVKVTYDIDRGKPAERILQAAKRDKCDLIAMSTHGRTGLRRWRYGSVTERVLRHSNRPMLIVRPNPEALNA